MTYRKPRVFMGGEPRPPAHTLSSTDTGRMRTLIDIAGETRP